MSSAIFHLHFAFSFRGLFFVETGLNLKVFEDLSFVCQNVTGGSGDILAIHRQSSKSLRREETPNKWKRFFFFFFLKKKTPENHNVSPCFLESHSKVH